MTFYDQSELPYYYSLDNQFGVADRYFCHVVSQTFPNRFFLYTSTAFGHISNNFPTDTTQFN